MKKRLLMAFAATCMAMTGFALTNGEYVYTPQGRFQITGANLNANNSFATFNGWTVASAAEGKTIDQNFVMNANGYAAGLHSVQSLDATAGEGMYYKFTPTSADGIYVVSYKMKGAATYSTRIKTTILSTNLVKVEGNTDGAYGGTTEVAIANTAEELTDQWQTFNYAIVGDGTPRTYFISFTGMATDIEIADVQIAPALQYADLRQRDAMVERYNAYINAYDWDEATLEEWGVTEALASLNGVGDTTGQDEMNEYLATAAEVLAEFLKENMEDYLAGNNTNYFNIDKWPGKIQKGDKLGDWTAFPAGRGFWENEGTYPDLGHYAGNSAWNYGAADGPMGVSMQKEFTTGSYVFAIESNAAIRENSSSSTWENNDGQKVAYGVAYLVKIVDGVAADTLVSVVKDLHPVIYTPFIVAAKVEEDGIYEIGMKAYCKDEYKSLKNGSVVYVKDASVWGKNDNIYTQAQLAYEADVREQITTGRTNLTTAAENMANATYYWGKADLQACVDTIAPRIEAYEAMSQDDIIATYQDYYEKTTANDNGLLVYEVYQTATKHIIAANRTFTAVNDTLTSLQTAIEAAKTTLAMRIYDAATGKSALQTAITTAEGVLTNMQLSQYSEENAATIVAAIAALNNAVDVFKTTIPASAITAIVDIDFEQNAVQSPETSLYSVAGNLGTMEFSNFSETTPTEATTNPPFEKGIWSNAEQLYKGYIRVGNGTGTVTFDPATAGSMGTNILKVTFEMYLQGLSGRNVGVFLKDESGENNVAAFYANYYDNKIADDNPANNTFGIELSSLQYGSGGSYANVAPEGAEGAEGTTCAKNSFEFIFDFGEKSMYCTTTSAKGTVTTAKKEFDGTIPASFVLQCNYNNKDRRIWFDNLKIERITAGPTDPFVDGIENVKAADEVAPAKKVKKVIENGRIIIDGKYDVKGMQIK